MQDVELRNSGPNRVLDLVLPLLTKMTADCPRSLDSAAAEAWNAVARYWHLGSMADIHASKYTVLSGCGQLIVVIVIAVRHAALMFQR